MSRMVDAIYLLDQSDGPSGLNEAQLADVSESEVSAWGEGPEASFLASEPQVLEFIYGCVERICVHSMCDMRHRANVLQDQP